MRRLWMTVAIAALGCSPAFAQVGGTSEPTPGIAATSPLGMSGSSQPGTSVGPTGIPLGATELTSPGISPMLTDPTGMMGSTCSVGGSASTGISGGISGVSTYDGGGLAVGGGMLGDSAAPCAASTGVASSMASVPSAFPSGASRTGIPLGSVEIGSAGVSPLITLPAPAASSSPMGTLGSSPSTTGTLTVPSTLASPTSPTSGTGFSTNQSTAPCGSIVTSAPAKFC
jgi:hypothetical protein